MSKAVDSYRYERKYLVEGLDDHEVNSIVKRHPRMFYESYPPRFVNNVYLDTADLENYYDNVDGASVRRKARIRWYGDLMGAIKAPVLEFKIKRGFVGRKRQFPFPGFDLASGCHDGILVERGEGSQLPPEVKGYLGTVKMVLMNRYRRRYYATRDSTYRVTVDTNVAFFRMDRLSNSFTHRQVDYQTLIVELKYGADHDASAFKVSEFFPFRVTKSSKYVQGVERVYF